MVRSVPFFYGATVDFCFLFYWRFGPEVARFRQEVAHPLASRFLLAQYERRGYLNQYISTSVSAKRPWYSQTIGPMMLAQGR